MGRTALCSSARIGVSHPTFTSNAIAQSRSSGSIRSPALRITVSQSMNYTKSSGSWYNINSRFVRPGMTTLVLEQDPVAGKGALAAGHPVVELGDGRSLTVPLAWYPRLLYGSPAERQNWLLLGDGYAIEWPDLDEHIGVEGLLAGRRRRESQTAVHPR